MKVTFYLNPIVVPFVALVFKLCQETSLEQKYVTWVVLVKWGQCLYIWLTIELIFGWWRLVEEAKI